MAPGGSVTLGKSCNLPVPKAIPEVSKQMLTYVGTENVQLERVVNTEGKTFREPGALSTLSSLLCLSLTWDPPKRQQAFLNVTSLS